TSRDRARRRVRRAPIRLCRCCRIAPPARRPVRSVTNLTPRGPADNLTAVLCVGVPLQRWFEHPEGWEGRAALWTGTRAPEGPISQPRHGSATRPRLTTDRKSTRLNSSHGSISYAVFCLKKKKQPRIARVYE